MKTGVNLPPNNKERSYYINEQIRGKSVRILDEGLNDFVAKDAAIKMAKARNLDLVQIAFDKNIKVPICKILDYGKFKYDKAKKEKNLKKMQKAAMVETKQVQFSLTTDDNDFKRIINHAHEFLDKGDKVKVALRFRNFRESKRIDLAKEMIMNFLKGFETVAVLDSKPQLTGKEMSCIIRPINKK